MVGKTLKGDDMKKTAEHPSGMRIEFDEATHTYTDDIGIEYVSGTQFVHRYCKPFDAEQMALHCSGNPRSEWYDVPVDEIIRAWDAKREAACALGTAVHWFIETGELSDGVYVPQAMYANAENAFHDFLSNHGFPEQEKIIFCPRYGIAGTVDALFYADRIIGDWKTNAEIKFENPFGKMLAPFDFLDDCNANHYRLQLNLYRFILERDYDCPIEGMKIVHITENGWNEYEMEEIENRIIKEALNAI
jgi:hypothetical protein